MKVNVKRFGRFDFDRPLLSPRAVGQSNPLLAQADAGGRDAHCIGPQPGPNACACIPLLSAGVDKLKVRSTRNLNPSASDGLAVGPPGHTDVDRRRAVNFDLDVGRLRPVRLENGSGPRTAGPLGIDDTQDVAVIRGDRQRESAVVSRSRIGNIAIPLRSKSKTTDQNTRRACAIGHHEPAFDRHLFADVNGGLPFGQTIAIDLVDLPIRVYQINAQPHHSVARHPREGRYPIGAGAHVTRLDRA